MTKSYVILDVKSNTYMTEQESGYYATKVWSTDISEAKRFQVDEGLPVYKRFEDMEMVIGEEVSKYGANSIFTFQPIYHNFHI